MARYIEWDDLVGRYRKAAEVSDAPEAETNYIRYAESEIDGMLAPYFTAPFSNNNETVKDLCIDKSFAMMIRFKDEEKAKMIDDSVTDRIDKLIKGKMSMVVGSGDIITRTSDIAYSTTKDYHPVFGMDVITEFHVSSSQLDNEENARDY